MRIITTLAVVAAATIGMPAQAPANTQHCLTKACLKRTCSSASCRERVELKYWERERRRLSHETKKMLARLRGCETRGLRYPRNYRYRGNHFGAYQYLDSTWHRAGGTQAHASDASPAEQDVRTARFYPRHRGEWDYRCRV